MASCLITNGWYTDCELDTGGIKTVYLTNKSSIKTIAPVLGAIGTPSDEGIVTSITMETGEYFFEFKPNKQSSMNESEFTKDVTKGSGGFKHTLTLVFSKNNADNRNQVLLMGTSEMVAIVLTKAGKYWIFGEDEALEMTSAKGGSGTAIGDLSGWTITLSSEGKYPAREVDADIVAALIAPVI